MRKPNSFAGLMFFVIFSIGLIVDYGVVGATTFTLRVF